jgi:hypothetical protein
MFKPGNRCVTMATTAGHQPRGPARTDLRVRRRLSALPGKIDASYLAAK